MYHQNSEAEFAIFYLVVVITTVFICILCVGCGIDGCTQRCSPLARHRREKETVARRKIDEYKEKQRRRAMNNTTMGGGGIAMEIMDDKVYECCYKGHDDSCGIAELHLAISPVVVGTDGCRSITGCGIRGEEFTEIIDGHIDKNGNAQFIEQTTTTREIISTTHQSNEGQMILPEHHNTEPVYILSKGEFDNTEPVYVTSCLHLNFRGEMFRGKGPASQMQKIGVYVHFQLKEKKNVLRQREQYAKRRHARPAPIHRPDGSAIMQRIDFETVDDVYGDPTWQAIEREFPLILSANMTSVEWERFCNEVDRVLSEAQAGSAKMRMIYNMIMWGLYIVVWVITLIYFHVDGVLAFLSFVGIIILLEPCVASVAAEYIIKRVDRVLAEESRRLLGVTFCLREQWCECKTRMTNGKRPKKASYSHHYIDCILDMAGVAGDCDYLPPSIIV